MKNTFSVLLFLFMILSVSSCNVFDWMEPTTDHFDRCKGLNDKGDFEAAIKECEKADPDGVDPEVQLELADARLATLGVGIEYLSDIFLNASDGTTTIISSAESLINIGSINWENHDDKMEYANDAIEAVDNYGEILKKNHAYCEEVYYVTNPAVECPQIAAFYSTLARVSLVSATLAYADIRPDTGNQNGKVEKRDICNPSNTNCVTATQTWACVNDPADGPFYNGKTCEGMLPEDAISATDALYTLTTNLSALNLPGLEDAVVDMVGLKVIDPSDGIEKEIIDMTPKYRADAGRDILRSIAR
ncbi:MAG TPA: hypothetical protein PK443_03690 [bacterium]|nr:hypothetical protein [bacterium]